MSFKSFNLWNPEKKNLAVEDKKVIEEDKKNLAVEDEVEDKKVIEEHKPNVMDIIAGKEQKKTIKSKISSIIKKVSTKGTPKFSPFDPQKPPSVKWNSKSSGLSQIYSRGLEICFLSNNFSQATSFVLCKDFLQDALMALHNDKPVSIFGFCYNPKKDMPICLDKTRVAIVNRQRDISKDIVRCIELLNQVESELRLERTKFAKAPNPPKSYNAAWILEGSCKWILAPPMISLYTLLIRSGMHHKRGNAWRRTIKDVMLSKIKKHKDGTLITKAGEAGSGDNTQIHSAMKGIERIMRDGYAKIFYKDADCNFPDVGVSQMHDSFGICGFSAGYTSSMKYWHKELKK